MKQIIFFFFGMLFLSSIKAQKITLLNQEKKDVSFRGLSVLDDSSFWVSGTKGTIGFTYNGGKSFKWVSPLGFEDRDFRSIKALDYKTVFALAVGEPGLIIFTKDGGKSWFTVYSDDSPSVFMDDLDLYDLNNKFGVAVGDPINNQSYILQSTNAGATWEKWEIEGLSSFQNGEAFFAASGSNVKLINDSTFIAVTGGSHSNLLINTKPLTKIALPKTNSETSGANGFDISLSEKFGMIVGGDFTQPDSSENNLFIFDFKDLKSPKISQAVTPPSGYRSGISIINQNKAITCGMNGVDYSEDGGKNWLKISSIGFHACKKSKIKSNVFLVGSDGKIGVFTP